MKHIFLYTAILFQMITLSSEATVYDLNTTADAGGAGTAGSLRYCITTANADATAGPHYIRASVAGTLNLASNLPAITRTIIIDGRTAPGYVAGTPTFTINGTGGRTIFTANAAINISVWGFAITSPNLDAINLQNTSGDTVSYCKFAVDNNTCVRISSAGAASGFVISNNTFIGGNTGTIADLTNASNVEINNNSGPLRNNTNDAIVIVGTVSNYNVNNNTITQGSNFLRSTGATLTNFTSTGNNINWRQSFGYSMSSVSTVNISSNTITAAGNSGPAISITIALNGSVSSNIISGSNTNDGILFTTSATNINCSNNNINRGAAGGAYGIKVTAGSTNTVNNNVIRFFNNTGLYLSGTGHTFNGNKVMNGGSIGINLSNAINCIGITDTVTNNNSFGVLINNSSKNNTFGGTGIGRCIITNNGNDGVKIDGANINQIINCLIAANTNASGVHILNNSRLNVVKSCLIGVDATGNVASANSSHGIWIETSGANNNTIGGTSVLDRNIISANGGNGIFFDNNGPDSTKILNNYIGVGANGTTVLVNGTGTSHHGIRMNSGSPGSAWNVIKNNVIVTPARGCGMSIESCSDDTISFNYIGIDATGSTLVGIGNTTGEFGIYMKGSAANEYICNNVISGSKGDGIKLDGGTFTNCIMNGNYMGTDATGLVKFGNGSTTSCHGIHTNSANFTTLTMLNNVIAASTGYGLWIDGGTSSNITFKGNIIGFNKNGLGTTFGNYNTGAYIRPTGTTVVIGGPNASDRNIVGKNGMGAALACATADGCGFAFENINGLTIQGNYVGVDATGLVAAGNGNTGIMMNGNNSNILIGGTLAGAGNVVCSNGFNCTPGNDRHGIQFVNSNTGTLNVQGNYVGVGIDGVTLLGNSSEGVGSWQTAAITIGGATTAHRNIIAGNGIGIHLQNGGTAAGNHVIQNNYIGTDVTGTIAKPNGTGIRIANYGTNTIGGAGVGNVISGNTNNGISLENSSTNTIQQNYIGVKSNMTFLGNGLNGIKIWANGGSGNSSNNLIGHATTTSLGNIIAYNSLNGILIVDNVSIRNAIRRNSIYCNGTARVNGINLNGLGNTNIGAPGPLVVPAYITAPNPGIAVANTPAGDIAATDVVEVFYDDGCGTCQGKTFLGNATNSGTQWSFSPLPAAADCSPKGTAACMSGIKNVTATRTDNVGNTSEFMDCDPLPLPVELISFTAHKYSADDVLIQWTTASEINNAYFELLRSTDGKTFKPIASIQGYGNSTSINKYEFIDEDLAPGIYYYTLIQVDFNGKQTINQIITVNTGSSSTIEVIPTALASGDQIKILNFTGSELLGISVTDMNGQVLVEKRSVADIETYISTSNLSSGVYLIKINTATDLIVKKVLVY
jgi:parallel beta-helix repeat protein